MYFCISSEEYDIDLPEKHGIVEPIEKAITINKKLPTKMNNLKWTPCDRTLSKLEELDISGQTYRTTYLNNSRAFMLVVCERKGLKISLLCFSCSLRSEGDTEY